jgi:DNA-binding NarL/FixJ family response regulator
MTLMNGLLRKLVIVEDELLMRSLLEKELSSQGFTVSSADSAVSAKQLIQQFDPDIALIDIDLKGGLSGLHLGHYLAVQNPEIAQIYLTKYEEAAAVSRDGLALPKGAGFISKHAVTESVYLVEFINEVIRGKDNQRLTVLDTFEKIDILGTKARRVLELLSEGYSNQHIAQVLGLSQKSVEYYIDQIYKTLNINKSSDRNPRVEAALKFQRLTFSRDSSDPPSLA